MPYRYYATVDTVLLNPWLIDIVHARQKEIYVIFSEETAVGRSNDLFFGRSVYERFFRQTSKIISKNKNEEEVEEGEEGEDGNGNGNGNGKINLISIERTIFNFLLNGRKLNKYIKDRDLFFKDSRNRFISLYYNKIGKNYK